MFGQGFVSVSTEVQLTYRLDSLQRQTFSGIHVLDIKHQIVDIVYAATCTGRTLDTRLFKQTSSPKRLAMKLVKGAA